MERGETEVWGGGSQENVRAEGTAASESVRPAPRCAPPGRPAASSGRVTDGCGAADFVGGSRR